jgi:hypothetical protein
MASATPSPSERTRRAVAQLHHVCVRSSNCERRGTFGNRRDLHVIWLFVEPTCEEITSRRQFRSAPCQGRRRHLFAEQPKFWANHSSLGSLQHNCTMFACDRGGAGRPAGGRHVCLKMNRVQSPFSPVSATGGNGKRSPNVRRRVGPERAGHFGLGALVEKTDALIPAWRLMATARLAGRIDTSRPSPLGEPTQ